MVHERAMTLLMLAFASAASEIASDDTRPVLSSLGISACWTAGAMVLAFLMPRPRQTRPSTMAIVMVIGFAISPVIAEPILRQQTGAGNPLELLMVRFLRCLGLGLAAAGAWRPFQHAAAICGLFLVLFSAAMSNHAGVMILVIAHAAAGSVWLMNEYRTGQAGVAQPKGMPVLVERLRGSSRAPWKRLAGVATLAAVIASLAVLLPPGGGWKLGEWIATSGGTGGHDPNARGGVGNGDDETEGDNPESTGMTRSDIFLDSPLPTLYDMASDMFGEPFKTKDQERVEALDPNQVKARETGKSPADNLRPNRSFPHNRGKPKQHAGARDRGARALFEVGGPCPVHVRVAAYDLFDGEAWREGSPAKPAIPAISRDKEAGKFVIRGETLPTAACFPARHEFKITNISGSLIPAPPNMRQFRLGRLTDPSFFAWFRPGILTFGDRKTPSGIILDAESLVPVPSRYESLRLAPHHPDTDPAWRQPFRQLAGEWTGGTTGWPAVMAIVDRLRREYRLDRESTCGTGGSGSALLRFLVEEKAGGAHMFAGAAAELMACSGCQTRLVTGFYATDSRRDPETGTVPVTSADLHAWAEVKTASGDWLVIEATPGYKLPEPEPDLLEILFAFGSALAKVVMSRPLAFAATAATAVAVFFMRGRVADALTHARLAMHDGTNPRAVVVRALRLIESRARRCGSPRPPQVTFSAWMPRCTDAPAIARLAIVSDWALYSDSPSAPLEGDQIRSLCLGCVNLWFEGAWNRLNWRGFRHGS